MVYKSMDNRKRASICFFFYYDNMEKVRAELTLFSVEKERSLHMTSFLMSVPLLMIAKSQLSRGNFDSYCKK